MRNENVYVVRTGRNFETSGIYGSLKAIGDHNPKEKIGVSLRVLYNHDFDGPYENAYTKIEKHTIIRSLQKPKKRGNNKPTIKRTVKGTVKKLTKR